jgi:hypothetical protein
VRFLKLFIVGILFVAICSVPSSREDSRAKADSFVTSLPLSTYGGVTLDPTGSFAYVSDGAGGLVRKIRVSDMSQVASIAVGANPFFLVTSIPANAVLVANGGTYVTPSSGSVSRIDVSTNSVTDIPVVGQPANIAVNSQGTYAATINGGVYPDTMVRVSVINLLDNTVRNIDIYDNGNGNPSNIAFDSTGSYVYFRKHSNNDMLKLDVVTAAVSTAFVITVDNPGAESTYVTGIGVDSSNAYVSLTGSRLQKYRLSDGAKIATLNTGFRNDIGHAGPFINPAGTYAYLTGYDPTSQQQSPLIKVNLATFRVASSMSFPHYKMGGSMSFSPSGDLAMVGNNNQIDKVSLTSTEAQTIVFPTVSDVLLGSRLLTVEATSSSGLDVSFTSSTNSVCTVSGNTVSLLTTGSCTINADQPGGSGWAAATRVSRTFSALAQTITFTPPTSKFTGDRTFSLSASATSNLNVTFTSATPAVCTVSSNTVTIVKKGTCSVEATQSGNTDWDQAATVRKDIAILLSPPPGEPGVSIKDGATYVNTKSVVLDLVWPAYATEARVSNDGGFSFSKTRIFEVDNLIDWELDDSVKGIFTKVVYVRFNGTGIDTSKTYSDDIILDTTAPTIDSSTASAKAGNVEIALKATDDITGVDQVQIKNGSKIITEDYDTSISVRDSDLGLVVSSGGVRKFGSSSVEIRVSDKAGNWSAYKNLSLSGVVNAPTVTSSKSVSAKSIALFAKLKVLSTSKVSLKVVASSKKFCKVSGTTLKGLKAGSCRVTVTVTPKKGRATSKTVTLKVTR